MSKKKRIETLVEDIYRLFETGVDVPDTLYQQFADRIAKVIKSRLKEYKGKKRQRHSVFRMSNVGKPDRLLWYQYRDKDDVRSETAPSGKIRFLYGDILEEMLLFFAELAGHRVENRQQRLNINGVEGSCDATIDDVLTDVKSSSPYAFYKFRDKLLLNKQHDPFGYIGQISGYAQARANKPYEEYDDQAAILAIDKSSGELQLVLLSDLEQPNIAERITQLRKTINLSTPPERCYEDKEYSQNGNRVLDKNCTFCKYKKECWADANDGKGLRVFKYADGPKYFTKVVKEPNVEEIKDA